MISNLSQSRPDLGDTQSPVRMETEEAMLKPESEDGKSTKGSSSSSSWVNCLVMTLLVISLTMAVAALWIPWERLNKLDRMTRENKDNFERLQRLILQINGTSEADSLSAKAELLKSFSLELERDIVKENTDLQESVSKKL